MRRGKKVENIRKKGKSAPSSGKYADHAAPTAAARRS